MHEFQKIFLRADFMRFKALYYVFGFELQIGIFN